MRRNTPLLCSLILVICLSFGCTKRKNKNKFAKKAQTQGKAWTIFNNRLNKQKSEKFWRTIEEEKFLAKRQINRLKSIESKNRNDLLEFRRSNGKMTDKIIEDFDLKKRLKFKEFLGDSLYIIFAIETKKIEEGKTKHIILKSN